MDTYTRGSCTRGREGPRTRRNAFEWEDQPDFFMPPVDTAASCELRESFICVETGRVERLCLPSRVPPSKEDVLPPVITFRIDRTPSYERFFVGYVSRRRLRVDSDSALRNHPGNGAPSLRGPHEKAGLIKTHRPKIPGPLRLSEWPRWCEGRKGEPRVMLQRSTTSAGRKEVEKGRGAGRPNLYLGATQGSRSRCGRSIAHRPAPNIHPAAFLSRSNCGVHVDDRHFTHSTLSCDCTPGTKFRSAQTPPTRSTSL